ncbi:MAG: CrcB family protein [Cyanobacteria bacterium K_DeepCast_35m_m2_023]|nr:CrcB family protein [Cyanobacteria bacterium K_DeepCast_35m_m2_023]
MSPSPSHLRREIDELALVAGGAIPGALLRWQLESLASAANGGLQGLFAGDLAANLLGCLLLGLLSATASTRARLLLWAGIGFCGSLTTFSSLMLELVRALDRGETQSSLHLLLVSLVGGLLLVALGRRAGKRWLSPAPAQKSDNS